MYWLICNSNKDKFMVVHYEWGSRSLWKIEDTFEEAYELAKIMGGGKEPKDETRHH